MKLIYTPTELQTADVLTKALPRNNFDNKCSKLGMYDNPALGSIVLCCKYCAVL